MGERGGRREAARARREPLVEVSVPPFFRCPISLDLMRDPVSVCTGVTYDRSSIEAWMDSGHSQCPVTKQDLGGRPAELIPNHTLRRLIQDWCVANLSLGVERIPTPKTPPDPFRLHRLLLEIGDTDNLLALRRLRSWASDSLRNCLCIAEAGAPAVLASLLASQCKAAQASSSSTTMTTTTSTSTSKSTSTGSRVSAVVPEACEEALAILVSIPLNEQAQRAFANPDNMYAFAFLLAAGKIETKINVATIVEKLAGDETMQADLGEVEGLLDGLVTTMRQVKSIKGMKAVLKSLFALGQFKKNRSNLVEFGLVPMLIEQLVEPLEAGVIEELCLGLMEQLCFCTRGRYAVREHALGIPILVKKLLRVSNIATEHAVGALWALCSFFSNDEQCVLEVASIGACSKLCLLLQVDSTPKARSRANKLLRLLHNYKDCPCCCNNTPFVK